MTTQVEKTIEVDVPVNIAYNQWTQFEDFPKFMDGIQSVQQLDDTHVQWVAEIRGESRQWTTEITEQQPDKKVAWKTIDGEVQDIHPHDQSVQRGVMVEIELSTPSAEGNSVLFAGGKPLWLF